MAFGWRAHGTMLLVILGIVIVFLVLGLGDQLAIFGDFDFPFLAVDGHLGLVHR